MKKFSENEKIYTINIQDFKRGIFTIIQKIKI